jgi:hypothetical protein
MAGPDGLLQGKEASVRRRGTSALGSMRHGELVINMVSTLLYVQVIQWKSATRRFQCLHGVKACCPVAEKATSICVYNIATSSVCSFHDTWGVHAVLNIRWLQLVQLSRLFSLVMAACAQKAKCRDLYLRAAMSFEPPKGSQSFVTFIFNFGAYARAVHRCLRQRGVSGLAGITDTGKTLATSY